MAKVGWTTPQRLVDRAGSRAGCSTATNAALMCLVQKLS
jgi:hypothetical protein